MVTTDVEHELAQQLKEAGRQLSQPPASVDDLLHILDETEKLLSKVDQSPNTFMVDALRPLLKTLVDDIFLNHSNIDVKVAVAACLCEITRITAPDAPFDDEKMKGVFQLIVSSFENLSDKSSRSYIKRASILDTVSKVRSCVIMLDLECEELIVEMFEHFLKSVRDHHEDNIVSPMENIMTLVLEESEDISVDILKPLLASIKNDTEGVLPVARKLGEGVLKKCASKVKPFLMETLRILGDSLDNYSQVLASICEGTIDDIEHNDETTSVQRQADESKLTSASSDNTAQVVTGNAETDATFDATLKSLGSNGRRVSGNEGGSANMESSKKPEEAINHLDPNPTSKVDTDDSVSEKLEKVESKPDQTSKRRGNKTDTTLKSSTPSDSPHGYDDNKIDKNIDVPKAIESEVPDAPSESGGLPDENSVKKDNLPKEPNAANAGALSQSRSIPCKSRTKRAVRTKKKSKSQDNEPLTEVVLTKAPEGTSGSDMKSAKRVRKKTTFAQDNKLPAAPSTKVVLTKAPEGMSDSDMKSPKRARKKPTVAQEDKLPAAPSTEVVLTKAPEGMSDSDMKSPKRARKKPTSAQEDKLPAAIATVEDSKATSGSDSKRLKRSSKKVDTIDPGSNQAKTYGKKMGGVDSVAKKPKLSDKETDAGDSEANKSKKAGTKDDESDSDAKPLNQFAGNKEKGRLKTKSSRHTANKEEGSDSNTQPLKLSSKKGDSSSSAPIKSSSKKKEGKKLKNIENVEEKDETKSLPEDDGMVVSPKSVVKTAIEESNLEETPVTTSKRKRAISKDKVAKTTNYDGSLVGQKIKVWWPLDKMYYEGVIESFDSAKKRHKVLYVDGETEILNLKTQKFEFLQNISGHNEDIPAEVTRDDETPKEKSKTSQDKPKDSAKRAGKASLSGKSKGLTSKSSASSKGKGKGKGKGKTGIKSKSQKNSGKSLKSTNLKDAEISEEDDVQLSKIIPKKQGTPKIVYKSKGKIITERGSKAHAKESIQPKSASVDVKESEDADAAEDSASPKGKKST